jgi:type IV secretory pathway TraG/TraD family ATPase VirD4
MAVPEGSGGSENQFFYAAARAGLFAYVVILQRYAPEWGLHQVVSGPLDQTTFYEILNLRPETRPFARYFKDSREGRAIHSTLRSCLDKFAVVAACQEHAKETFSCSEFQDQESVLVLGFDPAATSALSGLHQLVVQRLSETALRRQNMNDRTIFIFDEFRLWSKTPSETLVTTAFRGRSSGACLIIGTQDINGIDFIYRRELARELLASLLTKVFLGGGSIEAARFASECIGCHEVMQSTWNESWGQGGYSQSVNRSIVRRELVTLDEIMALRKADWHRDRIEGYCITPFTPPFRFETNIRRVAEAIRPPIDFVPNRPRPKKHQSLRAFRLKDAKALNFPPRPALLKALS